MDSVEIKHEFKNSMQKEALDKLGFKHLYGQSPVEPVQPNVAFDIASLVLYGTQALPIRLKILLDRLFSVLQREEVLQVLHGFGWTHEDYARGYILQEPHGNVLERWNICSPEEEPLVLQQFLRFGETRAITQQLLLAQADQAAAALAATAVERDRSSSEREKERERERHLQMQQQQQQQQLKVESDIKKFMEKSGLKPPKLEVAPGMEERAKVQREDRERPSRSRISPPRRLSPPLPPHLASSLPPSSRPSPAPPSPLQKQSPLNLLKISNGPSCTVSSPPSSLNTSPLSVSPLNRLQNMQPFDFRKMAGVGNFSSDVGRRRPSDPSETSPSLGVTSPTHHMPPPLPLPTSTGSVPVNLSHPGLLGSDGQASKSPSSHHDRDKGASSEFGSDDDEEDEENAHSALNLSRDGLQKHLKKQNHHRKGMSPLKRAWGASAGLPLNLGTQLINPATGKKRVQCNVCLKTFCDKGALKIHFSAVHLREMHKCTVEGCNMMFSSRRSRNRHSANPNPKLHSPHLRRKISPHDGRSAQSHPILIPPHGALPLPGGGLNPLSFGAFPLLTPPPELRHQASALDLKQSLDLTLSKYDERRSEFSSNTNQSSDDGGGMTDGRGHYDDMDDEDDYEGIVVVGDDEQDQDTEENLDKNSEEEVGSKRAKMSVSDMDDVASNVDSNEDSQSVVDNQSIKEVGDEAGGRPLPVKSKRGRKRKNQNPTRCALPVRSSHDDGMSTDGEGSQDNMFNSSKDNKQVRDEYGGELLRDSKGQLRDTEGSGRRSEDSKLEGEGNCKDSLSSYYQGMKLKGDRDETDLRKRLEGGESGCEEEAGNPLRHLESLSQGRFGDSKRGEDEGQASPLRSRSHSTGSHQSDPPDSPLDDNSEAFSTKRGRERHTSSLGMHRKLLSSPEKPSTGSWGPSNPSFHSDFLSRLYSESQSLPLSYVEALKNHQHLMPDGLLNGERMGHLGFPPLGFPGLAGLASHPFLQNGLERKEHGSGSTSPSSPSPSLELDPPTPDRDGMLPCKLCRKPFPEAGSLKEHYEQMHASDLFRCSVAGCSKAFTSRSRRNAHSERHCDPSGGQSARRTSSSSAENGS